MKLIITILFMICSTGCLPSANSVRDALAIAARPLSHDGEEQAVFDKMAREMESGIAMVRANEGPLCGGVLVEPDLVITAKSCVGNIETTKVVWRSGAEARALSVVHEAEESTYALSALLLQEKAASRPLAFGESPKNGQTEAVIIGHPGEASAFKVVPVMVARDEASVAILGDVYGGGFEGSPVLDDAGRVVAIFRGPRTITPLADSFPRVDSGAVPDVIRALVGKARGR